MPPLLLISIFHFFIFLLFVPLPSSSTLTHRPHCTTRCGNLSIPYPFGVGSDCSLGASFNISCNTSTTPPKPYLSIDHEAIELVEIRLDNPAQIRIKYPHLLDGACYNRSSGKRTWSSDWNSIDLSESQYSLSEDNWLTAIGCNDIVASTSYIGNQSFRDACVGFCSNRRNSTDMGNCPNNGDMNSVGEGCCRTPISSTSYLNAGLVDLSKSWNRTRAFPCGYTFVQEKGIEKKAGYAYKFSFLQQNSTAFLPNDGETTNLLVVRLDWRIGTQNCSRTPRNSNFACQANTDCVDFDANVGGYLCNCSQGYAGNPYLYPGCTDINECDDDNPPCDSYSDCINTPGSFRCPCRRGYSGDGRISGSGCTRLPPRSMINIFLIVLGSALGLLLLLLFYFWLNKVFEKRKNKKHKEDLFKHLLLQQQTSEGTFGKTKLFSAKELEKATDHFNESRICGRGGQGIVYKGMLSDGTIVAIKRISQVDENQVEQFINEVVILSQINHKNVIRLLGCCLETDAPLLVYEFLPNGTLFDLIRDTKIEFPLTWNMRLKIAADVAGALAYLHSASSIPIYHRDIKSTNILLDEKYIVKVSDFGVSKRVEVDQTHLTTLVRGTFGYLDPEYYQTSHYTEKSDVYSFGVILVELLTGQRPISLERSERERNLATHFLASMQENNLDAVLDTQVSGQSAQEEVIAVARLARRCLNGKGKLRPTMNEVAIELESLRISQIASTVNDKPEEATVSEGKRMMFSDIEYTWTITDNSMPTSSSDSHPLMSEGV